MQQVGHLCQKSGELEDTFIGVVLFFGARILTRLEDLEPPYSVVISVSVDWYGWSGGGVG
jgi:hypothetical protein